MITPHRPPELLCTALADPSSIKRAQYSITACEIRGLKQNEESTEIVVRMSNDLAGP